MTARWITAALLLVASPVVGQEPVPALEVGDRVRVTDSSRVVVGTLLALDSADVRIQTDSAEDAGPFRCLNELDWERCEASWSARATSGAELSWPLSEIEALEVSRDSSGRGGSGALVGFVLGAVVGVVLGLTDEPAPCPPPPPQCDNPFCGGLCEGETSGDEVVLGALLGFVGAGVGALIGSSIKTDIWEPVELSAKPMVAVHPTGCFSVGVSIPLRQ